LTSSECVGSDDHLGVARPRTVEHVGIACKPPDPLHVAYRRGGAQNSALPVTIRDGSLRLARKMAGDLPRDLPLRRK